MTSACYHVNSTLGILCAEFGTKSALMRPSTITFTTRTDLLSQSTWLAHTGYHKAASTVDWFSMQWLRESSYTDHMLYYTVALLTIFSDILQDLLVYCKCHSLLTIYEWLKWSFALYQIQLYPLISHVLSISILFKNPSCRWRWVKISKWLDQ